MLFFDIQPETFCSETIDVWKFAGKCLMIFKIVIPVILVILGVIGLGKAVIMDDEKETKKQIYMLIRKIIVAVCIFFVPTIVLSIIGLVADWGEYDWKLCVQCVDKPGSCAASTNSNADADADANNGGN